MLAESAVAGASQASSTVMFVLVYTQISPAIVRLCRTISPALSCVFAASARRGERIGSARPDGHDAFVRLDQLPFA